MLRKHPSGRQARLANPSATTLLCAVQSNTLNAAFVGQVSKLVGVFTHGNDMDPPPVSE
jgi:hypothetical protein